MKDKERIENSEINPVSRARSYGVVKKETAFTRANELLADVLYGMLIFFCFAIIVLGCIGTVYILQELGVALLTVAALLFVWFVPLRKIRKRYFFVRKLERISKKAGYRLTLVRGTLKSLKSSRDQYDFFLETEDTVWSVRLVSTKKYNCVLTFMDKDTLKTVTPRPQETFRVRAMYRPSKTRMHDFSFTGEPIRVEGKESRIAVLLNPVPHTVCVKLRDGAEVPTGTGEAFGDFTIFTSTGFIQALKRGI
jgi:hypothetical protein